MQRMMAKGRWMLMVALIASISGVTLYRFSIRQTVTTAQYPITRTIKYSFTVKNPNNYPISGSELWVYAPLKGGAFQHLSALTADHPYREDEDHLGNMRMKFAIGQLPPYASTNITIKATVDLSEQGHRVDDLQEESYLSDEKLVALNDAGINRLAASLKADTPVDTVKKIYDWITGNIKRSGYQKQDLGARYALANKSGDCTEFMYLFSALARANGIPTRNLSGFVVRENKVLRAAEYHNWNEVFIDGKWRLIDTEKRVFMRNSSEYIAMRLIVDSADLSFADAQSFFSSSNDIRVTMN